MIRSLREPFREGRKSLLGEDDFVESEKLLGVEIGSAGEKSVLHVAGGQIGLLVEAVADHQGLLGILDGIGQERDETLGLGFLDGKSVNREDVAGEDALAESFAEGKDLDL